MRCAAVGMFPDLWRTEVQIAMKQTNLPKLVFFVAEAVEVM